MDPALLDLRPILTVAIRRRLNRFVVSVEHKGKMRRAHINNTGRLEQFLVPGRTGFGLFPPRPGATDMRLFAVADGNAAAVIDTQLQMRAFERSVEAGLIPWLKGYTSFKRHAPQEHSRIDYRWEGAGAPLWLEAKSAVLRQGERAMYPDCPSLRGQRHIRTLTALAQAGGRAAILFIAALPRVNAFSPHRAADPVHSDLLKQAAASGVGLHAIGMYFDPGDAAVRLYAADLPVKWPDASAS